MRFSRSCFASFFAYQNDKPGRLLFVCNLVLKFFKFYIHFFALFSTRSKETILV
jgi:hypothetical protein